jgi:hypothetical protein
MKLGALDISTVKLGANQVQAVYLGSNLVWQNAPVAIAATGVGTTSFTANWNAYSGATYYLLDVSESSDFSTFVYENQIVYAPTTSYVVIGLNSNTTYYYRVRASDFELEAQDFFDRVADAGGALSTIEKDAVNILVTDMKADGIWTKMKAIYPMVGASAASCAQNLKSSSFTGTFSATGWTFSSTGVLGNGTNNQATTGYVQTDFLFGLSIYNRTNSNKLGYDIGQQDAIANAWVHLLLGLGSTSMRARNGTNGNIDYNYGATNEGFWQTNRIGTSTNGWNVNFNGAVVAQNSAFGNALPTAGVIIGGNGGIYPNREYAFASMHDGLTDTEASNYYIAVQGFNTTLDRYVGAPWYDNGELLLDAYPDSAAAYSLRKLRNNYIGGPIRVRRSSDNEEQDIYFDANGELDTTQLTTFCGAGDGFVETWYDQSGNALDATQVNVSKSTADC